MTSIVFFLVLAAAFLHAGWNIIVKGGDNKQFEVAMNALGGGILAIFILPFMNPLPKDCLIFLSLSCATHLFYYFALAATYKAADLSLSYTIMRGTAPLITAVILFFFNVSLSFLGWIGILLLCAGILCLGLEQKLTRQNNYKGLLYALGTSVIISLYTLADGYGARMAQNALIYTCWLYIIDAIPINLYMLIKSGNNFFSYLKARYRKGIFGGFCGFCSYSIAIWAMTKAPIASVEALRETSVIFGMIMAVFFLGEKLTFWRIIAIFLVVCGAILLRLY